MFGFWVRLVVVVVVVVVTLVLVVALQVLSGVTLEPMLFLKMIAEGNFGVVADTLEKDRVCRVNLNFSEEECAGWIHDANFTYVKVRDTV